MCYGCSACENICPKKAIEMIYNDEGFLIPRIDKEKCLNCNLCESVCPRMVNLRTQDMKLPQKCFFIHKKNQDNDLKNSTSSGICFEIAKHFLENDGYVCGCIWNNMKAEHVLTNDIDIVRKMQGTKYVQSDIQYVYEGIKEVLNRNKKVVFFGMACQIQGVKNYLKNNFSNILYVQIICRSVPSPKVFEEYKNCVEKKYKKKLVNINFRYKGNGGWLTPNTMYYFEDSTKKEIVSNPYVIGFGKGLFDRKSCIECQMKGNFNIADIILGDAWGINSGEFIKSENKGASSVIINSEKGKKVYENISNLYYQKEVELTTIAKENPALLKRCEENSERKKCLTKIVENKSFPEKEFLSKKHFVKNVLAELGLLSISKKIKYIIKHK